LSKIKYLEKYLPFPEIPSTKRLAMIGEYEVYLHYITLKLYLKANCIKCKFVHFETHIHFFLGLSSNTGTLTMTLNSQIMF